MKKIIFLFLFFVGTLSYSQTNGITYQAVIMNTQGNQSSSANTPNSPLIKRNVCLSFTLIDEFSNIEYQESVPAKTDQFGMVNLIIGSGYQTDGYAKSFQSIVWNSSNKSLIVAIDVDGNCANYVEISNQQFNYVPNAYYASNAENVVGIVSTENGGTNATTILGAKINFEIENVDNTRDLDKPVSILTKASLNNKEDLVNKSTNLTRDGASDTMYPTVKSVKTYIDANLTGNSTALTEEISRATTAENTIAADLVTEANSRTSADATLKTDLATEVSRATTAENTIAADVVTETNTRTLADATLTSNLATEVTNRTNADLLKEDLANKSTNLTTDGASDTKYPTVKSVKTYVDASATSSSAALAAEVSRATTAESTIAADLVTETNTRTAADATLTTNFATEVSRATTAENAIAADLVTETNTRTAADGTLTSNLATEVTNRTNADLLKEDLANKSTNLTTDGASDTKYPTVKSVKTYVDASATSSSAALAAEVSRATTAENAIAADLVTETNTRTAADANLTTDLATEVSRATTAENTIAADVVTETNARTASDATLTTNLATEVSRATTAENTIAADVVTETNARTAADVTLTTNLAAEVINRTNADLLKEDLANKSTNLTTDGASDTKYPSVKSVKTYVDSSATSSSAALTAEVSRATTAENTIAADLVTETNARTTADATLTTNLAAEVSRATTAENTIVADLVTETNARTAADANLTTDLATEVSRATTAENAIAADVVTETNARTTADATLTTDLATEVSRATTAENTIAADLVTETNTRSTADATLTTNLATEVTNRTNADLLKEDLANKSTNLTTDGASDTKYPTVKSVKTYVDASATSSSSALATEVSRATTAENAIAADVVTETNARTTADATLTTNLAAEISRATTAENTIAADLVSETNARTASDATLTTNLATEVSRATTAENAIAADVVTETNARTTADATLTTNLATEVTNRTNADLLKEDLANKSTNLTTDGASDTKYPTVKSVKTYVDASATSSSSALATEVSRATTAENTIAADLVTETNARTAADGTLTTNLSTEVTNRTNADLLKEDLANKSTNLTTDGASDAKYPSVKSVKTYVDASATSSSAALTAEVSRATTAENTIAADLVTETNTRTAADADLTTDLATEVSRATTAENTIAADLVTETNTRTAADGTLTSNLATEVTNRTNADLLKEDLANKSTNLTTDGASDTKYPSVKSVKTYVDASATSSSAALAAEVSRATTAENIIAADVVTETNARTTADATLTTNLAAEVTNRTNADLLKEDLANKSTNLTTDGASDTKYPTVKSVKTYVDAEISTSETGTQTALNLKANLASPTFTGTVLGIDKTMVGLTNVDNTTDLDKPVSTATQTALDVKANLDSPTFTGVPIAPTAAALTASTQIATTEFVTNAISTSSASFLPLSGGTLSGTLIGTSGEFSSNVKVSSLTLAGTSTWEFGINGTNLSLLQGGCCGRLTIDSNGRFGIGANYTPSFQLDVEGDGRFTSSLTATSFIKSGGTSTEFLKADGSIDSNVYLTSLDNATNVTGIVAIANGGTGSSTQNFVDLSTSQTINGTKNFSSQVFVQSLNSSANIYVNSLKMGTPGGSQNTMLGDGPFTWPASIGSNNTVMGNFAFTSSSGSFNTAIGSNAMRQGSGGFGDYNTAIGESSMSNAQAGNKNTAIGVNTLNGTIGSDNVSIGFEAGRAVTSGNQNTFLGSGADVQTGSETIVNSTAIGYNAKAVNDNTIQLGNSSVVAVNTSAAITAASYVKSGGTSTEYLMADGTVSTGPIAIQEVADEFLATASQTSFTLTQSPSTNSKVKMYVNGIRISNSAYSVSSTTLTYNPTNNGGYSLSVNDRIQFDYFY